MHNPAVLLDLLMTPPCWRSSNYSPLTTLSPSQTTLHSLLTGKLCGIFNCFCQWLILYAKCKSGQNCQFILSEYRSLGGIKIEMICHENKYLKCNHCFPLLSCRALGSVNNYFRARNNYQADTSFARKDCQPASLVMLNNHHASTLSSSSLSKALPSLSPTRVLVDSDLFWWKICTICKCLMQLNAKAYKNLLKS